MLRGISVAVLLRLVMITLALIAVSGLGLLVWDGWGVLGSSGRILQVASASEDAFIAMLNIRTDRNSTPRAWRADVVAPPLVRDYIKPLHDAEMAALGRALPVLNGLNFTDKARLLPELIRVHAKLATLYQVPYLLTVAHSLFPIDRMRSGSLTRNLHVLRQASMISS